MPIHVSLGNTKLGKVPNISLVPGKDCGNCLPCINECYAVRPQHQYPDTREAWEENSRILREDYLDFFFQLYVWFTSRNTKPKYFRVHVGGDFINQKIVDQWFKLARTYHKTKFFAYTKMVCFDYSKRPKNFSVILSQWPGAPLLKQYHAKLRSAWLSNDIRAPKNAFKCMKSCDECRYCWDGMKDVVLEEK